MRWIAHAVLRMDPDQVSQSLSEIGRKGGHARAKRLSPKKQREIAAKASLAAAKVRREKAKNRKPRKCAMITKEPRALESELIFNSRFMWSCGFIRIARELFVEPGRKTKPWRPVVP